MLTTPVKTRRSLAWIASSGPTGPIDLAVAVDLDQEQARQVPQPRLADRLAHQPAARLDQHLHQVLPPRLLELLDQLLAVRQELAGRSVSR